MMKAFLNVLKKEGSIYPGDTERYIAERSEKIRVAKELAGQFSKGRSQKDMVQEIGTALGGIVGENGKTVVIGADGQTSAGNIKHAMDSKKIYEIDKYTVVAGTGTVAFIHHIVRIFEADINFIQMSRSDGTVISPNGKVNILSSLVQSILALDLYFGIGVGFLLGIYDPKDDEARLFHFDSFGAVTEKDIAAHGCGWPWVYAILDNYYKEMGGKNMDRKNLKWLARRAVEIAIRNDAFCGGEKLLYVIDKNGARRTR